MRTSEQSYGARARTNADAACESQQTTRRSASAHLASQAIGAPPPRRVAIFGQTQERFQTLLRRCTPPSRRKPAAFLIFWIGHPPRAAALDRVLALELRHSAEGRSLQQKPPRAAVLARGVLALQPVLKGGRRGLGRVRATACRAVGALHRRRRRRLGRSVVRWDATRPLAGPLLPRRCYEDAGCGHRALARVVAAAAARPCEGVGAARRDRRRCPATLRMGRRRHAAKSTNTLARTDHARASAEGATATASSSVRQPRGGCTKHARCYTAKEADAWAHRPLHFSGGLADAVRYRDAQSPVRQSEMQEANRELARRRRVQEQARAAIPCAAQEHPTRLGRPGKLYDWHDRITPIVDSISHMNELRPSTADAFGLIERPRKRGPPATYDELELAEEAARARERLDSQHGGKARRARQVAIDDATGWRCANCGNRNPASQIQGKDALVCPCGNVIRVGGEIVATCRERLGALADADKTLHADNWNSARRNKYDGPPPAADEARRERSSTGRVAALPSRRMGKGVGRICDAQRIVDGERGRDVCASAVAAGEGLSAKEEVKGKRALLHLETMFTTMTPVEQSVRREIRKTVDVAWVRAVRHCRLCVNTACELRLVDRPPALIAAAAFEVALSASLEETQPIPGTTKQHVADLQARFHRSTHYAAAANAAQVRLTACMIRLISANEAVIARPCQSVAETSLALPSATTPPSHARRARTTDANDRSEPSHEGNVCMQQLVVKVFLVLRSDMPTAVRDGAMHALQSASFARAVMGIECLARFSLQGVAFCLLNAVAREQADAVASFSRPAAELNVNLAHRLELDLAAAEKGIQEMRSLLSTKAVSTIRPPKHDDDLFSA